MVTYKNSYFVSFFPLCEEQEGLFLNSTFHRELSHWFIDLPGLTLTHVSSPFIPTASILGFLRVESSVVFLLLLFQEIKHLVKYKALKNK